jgi:hypothetical protein
MYRFIAQDNQGNWYASKKIYTTKIEAEEEAFNMTEYDFIVSIQIVSEDMMGYFNKLQTILN